jgi:hypothetical protein
MVRLQPRLAAVAPNTAPVANAASHTCCIILLKTSVLVTSAAGEHAAGGSSY